MKKILLVTSAVSLLATTGCLVADGRYHEHGHYRHEEYRHEEIEGPRRVIVEPALPVIVRPEIIIH